MMVEKPTVDALSRYTAALRCRLSEELAAELARLLTEALAVSNWLDAGRWLRDHGFARLSAEGPMSKVLRTLAYTLERLAEQPPPESATLTAIRLSQCASGCSTFGGQVLVRGEQHGRPTEILSGGFLWDCGAWGLPQDVAARQRGYACMVDFPALERIPAA